MKDTLATECFVQALEEYTEAKAAELEAWDKYDGYSWGHHGAHYIDRKAKAALALADAMKGLIAEIMGDLRDETKP